MIKNRELALIPDSALELVEPPPTSSAPTPRASTARASRAPRATDRRPARRSECSAR
ncbi:hypothetical protein [Actinomycetospora aeridis]|uniref:Uncharacterized protein n=1 Tax=Actinomycetospora aeridis TaxID=3129231 RepID=A0ABU8N1Z4_9PSEU